jgi:hypothetical protein
MKGMKMSTNSPQIDHETIDYYMRKAHAARADAFAAVFAAAGHQIKSLFSSPDTEPECEAC